MVNQNLKNHLMRMINVIQKDYYSIIKLAVETVVQKYVKIL